MLRREREEVSFWPALTDFILAILMLILVLWAADAGMRAIRELNDRKAAAEELKGLIKLKPDEQVISIDVLKSLQPKSDEKIVKVTDWDARVSLAPHQQVIDKAELKRLQGRIELQPDEKVVKIKDIAGLTPVGPDERVIKLADLLKLVEVKPGEKIAKITDLEELQRLQEEFKRRPDKPLVFDLEDASGFTFDSGKADLSPDFVRKLRTDIVPKIREIVGEYNVEVMEVIGHTDGQPVNRNSNFDSKLNGLDLGRGANLGFQDLKPGSNADLGLARALSVTAFLHSEFAATNDPKLSALSCRAYSGAQIISPKTNTIEGARDANDPSRRRIELRFMRSPKRTP